MSNLKTFLKTSDIVVQEVAQMQLIICHDVDSSVFSTDDDAKDKQFPKKYGYSFAYLGDYQCFWQLLIEDIDKQLLGIRGMMMKRLLAPIDVSAHGVE